MTLFFSVFVFVFFLFCVVFFFFFERETERMVLCSCPQQSMSWLCCCHFNMESKDSKPYFLSQSRLSWSLLNAVNYWELTLLSKVLVLLHALHMPLEVLYN